jgi:hypothetical protein
MKERIFIISPLPEDEEEEKFPYDKHGNTTATAYYDERGNEIDTDYQEQPKPETTTEKHIIIIYEAPKPKVIFQENDITKIALTIPTTEENKISFPNQSETTIAPTQIEENSSKNHLYRYYPSLAERVYEQSKQNYLAGKELPQPHERYEKLINFFKVQEPTKESQFTPRTTEPYGKLINFFNSQSSTEENQLTSIRSGLAALTPASGAPAPHAGEIAQAA